MNHCPKKAVGTAHGMATGFMFLIAAANSGLVVLLLSAFNIRPDALWWKLSTQVLGILVLILVPAVVYSIIHTAMGFGPFHYLVKYTSLTTLPFRRRYRFQSGKTARESLQGGR